MNNIELSNEQIEQIAKRVVELMSGANTATKANVYETEPLGEGQFVNIKNCGEIEDFNWDYIDNADYYELIWPDTSRYLTSKFITINNPLYGVIIGEIHLSLINIYRYLNVKDHNSPLYDANYIIRATVETTDDIARRSHLLQICEPYSWSHKHHLPRLLWVDENGLRISNEWKNGEWKNRLDESDNQFPKQKLDNIIEEDKNA